MNEKENLYIYYLFKLASLVIIAFCFLVLAVLLCDFGSEGIFLRAEVPSMCISLICSLVILIIELIFWYIDIPSLIKKHRQ